MIDPSDLLRGTLPAHAPVVARLRSLASSVPIFAAGCACSAMFYAAAGVWCSMVPAGLAEISVVLARPRGITPP
jgi:hypothetical protein